MKRARRRRAKRVLGHVVSLGTAGLSSCITSGGVDPPPPPPRCENINTERDLHATVAKGDGGVLVARVEYSGSQVTRLETPRVGRVEGASLVGVREEPAGRVVIELKPDDPAPPRVFFVLEGAFAGLAGCRFERGFTITLGDVVDIAEGGTTLPFGGQPRARILVAGREERQVTLRAFSSPPGRHVAWSVTAGALQLAKGDQTVWVLPEEPGLYQAELYVDHGDQGFALDTLVLEVSEARRPSGSLGERRQRDS